MYLCTYIVAMLIEWDYAWRLQVRQLLRVLFCSITCVFLYLVIILSQHYYFPNSLRLIPAEILHNSFNYIIKNFTVVGCVSRNRKWEKLLFSHQPGKLQIAKHNFYTRKIYANTAQSCCVSFYLLGNDPLLWDSLDFANGWITLLLEGLHPISLGELTPLQLKI